MSRRAEKSLLVFSKGEVTPLLAGRTDVEPIQSGCRTLQNMFVDVEGSVTRRPGIQFVAEAKGAFVISYASLTGTGTMYGITEFGDVSDPPRKYLELHHNNRGYWRGKARTADNNLVLANVKERVVYNTSGAKIDQLSLSSERNANGSPTDSWFVSGTGGTVNGDTAEEINPVSGNWSGAGDDDYLPIWVRAKRLKYFESFDEISNELAFSPEFNWGLDNILAVSTGINGVIFHLPEVDGDVWKMRIRLQVSGPSVGTRTLQIYWKSAAGDQDTGEPSASDILIRTFTVSGTGAQFADFDLNLPPDTSHRFFLRHSTSLGGEQATAVFPEKFSDEQAENATVQPWIYVPAITTTDGTNPEDMARYAEVLLNEDTFYAALARGSSTPGTLAIAETTFIGGSGAEAESHVPLDITATAVQATIAVTGLITGHLYNYTITFRDQDIGGGGATTVQETGSFTAGGTTFNLVHEFAAPNGKTRRIVAVAVADQGEPATPADYEPETLAWQGEVLAAGGTLEADSLELANDLIVALKAESFYGKIKYLLPFLGADLAAGITPLIGNFAFGRPTNTAFVDADFDQSTGLQGNGTTKVLTLPFNASELGTSNNGGLGYWELDISGISANTGPAGARDAAGGGDNRYMLNLLSTAEQFFWGILGTGNQISTGNPSTNSHYYGQRASATDRELFRDGVSIGTNTNSDSAAGTGDFDMRLMGHNAPTPTFWAGRGGLFYATNGAMSDAEITSLHSILNTFMTAAGRV